MNIDDIKKVEFIDLKPTDIVVATVDIKHTLSNDKVSKYLNNIHDQLKVVFNKNKVLVVDSSIKLSTYNNDESSASSTD